MTLNRQLIAEKVRNDAAAIAQNRVHPKHQANGDEQRYASANYPMNFTKGLNHCFQTGLVNEAGDFEAYRAAIDNGIVQAFTIDVPIPRVDINGDEQPRRKWEAPTAGTVYDLQGPDSQAVTMPPAPELCSDELCFEMAEVYELALLRDVPFNTFDAGGGSSALTAAINRLNNLDYAKDGFYGRPRLTDDLGNLDRQTVFRGSSPGVTDGPYLSQFMLIGNDSPSENIVASDGRINFGAQYIDQRVLVAEKQDDYMMTWKDWFHVQQGFDVSAAGGGPCDARHPGQKFTGDRRFIYSLRDLATYVHIDALYQAYLNACLILLGNGTPFDPAFDTLSGLSSGLLVDPVNGEKVPQNAGGFALWGGPHILSLVTEVATRALKAVRFQKFNNHIRLRPEALAARIEKADTLEALYPQLCGCFTDMADDLKEVIDKVRSHNDDLSGEATALLPMAFKEGSPMHPAYGAGHATVAGACVTILKAFFDTSAVFVKIGKSAGFFSMDKILEELKCDHEVKVGFYQSVNGGKALKFTECGKYVLEKVGDKEVALFKPEKTKDYGCCPLTLEGELNKLAANISIGRNMAGVHYFSDYYDSLRMGEEIAIGMLEEQAICYPYDPFVMSVPTYDGEVVRIGRR